MSNKKMETGRTGELLVQSYLLDKGYSILETNYRQKFGEIDIIALKNDTLAFIEVRTKTSLNFGTAAESITYSKKQKIKRVAQCYLARLAKSRGKGLAFQFDVITVFIDKKSQEIEHYERAF